MFMIKTEAIELVVYRLREAAARNKQVIVEQTNRGLASLGGFVAREVYQCTDDTTLMLDYVRWSSLPEAESAAKNMMQVKALEQFVNLIEKTEVFEHFHAIEEHVVVAAPTDTVEVVMYQLKQEHITDIKDFFNVYSREIGTMAGYHQRVLLQSTKTAGLFVERVFWRAAAHAVAATKAMENNAALGEAFGMVEKVVMMKHFQKI
jgi:hypothetical protein